MSDINVKCQSLSNGTLSPDLRVNYEFGMVLGVKEFRQEQEYFLQKDYLYNRALHGYGTVYGLKVTAERPSDDPKDVQLKVEPGMALDQWGRPIVVRDYQCARLKTWLDRQKQEHPEKIKPGPSGELTVYVLARFEECKDLLVPVPGQPCSSDQATQLPSRIRDCYNIELSWDRPAMPGWETVQRMASLFELIRLVPNLPLSQSDEEIITALVRVVDKPELFVLPEIGASETPGPIIKSGGTELGLGNLLGAARPANPFEGVLVSSSETSMVIRSLAEGLRQLKKSGIPANALSGRNLSQTLQAIRQEQFATEIGLSAGGSPPEVEPGYLLLPAETAREALDRIMTVWITEVRNRLKPDLTDPASTNVSGQNAPETSANILLATLNFIEEEAFNSDYQVLVPDNTLRPYLLHTQLIQALKLSKDQGAIRPPHLFASLHVRTANKLIAEVHHPQLIELATNPSHSLLVSSAGERLKISSVTRLSRSENLFEITLDDTTLIEPGSLVEVSFVLDQIRLGRAGSTLELDPFNYDRLGFDYLDHDRESNTIVARTYAPEIPLTQSLASISTEIPEKGQPFLQLWFHTAQAVHLPETLLALDVLNDRELEFLARPAKEIVGPRPVAPAGRRTKKSATGPADTLPLDEAFGQVWILQPAREQALTDGMLLIFNLNTDQVLLGKALNLTQFIKNTYTDYVGYDGAKKVSLYHIVEIPAKEETPEPPPVTLAEVYRHLLAVHTMELVTITTITAQEIPDVPDPKNPLAFELWFHLAPDPLHDNVRLNYKPDEFIKLKDLIEVYAETDGNSPFPLPIEYLRAGPQHNVIDLTLVQNDWKEANNSPYLRFVFRFKEIPVKVDDTDTMPLEELMKKAFIKYQGHDGADRIMVPVRFEQTVKGK